MRRNIHFFILVATGLFSAELISTEVHAQSETLKCRSGKEAIALFRSDEWENNSNYVEGPGARVQRQFPNTSLFGQTKYVNSSKVVLCQYSNHIGFVFAVYAGPAEILEMEPCTGEKCDFKPYWRPEWVESAPELDNPDELKVLACVEERDGLAYPSVGCHYQLPIAED